VARQYGLNANLLHKWSYLPEVSANHYWGRKFMLTQLALKAGLPPPMAGKGASVVRHSAPRNSAHRIRISQSLTECVAWAAN
jgi:hypothetical protein